MMAGTCLRVTTSVSTEEAPETSNASTQTRTGKERDLSRGGRLQGDLTPFSWRNGKGLASDGQKLTICGIRWPSCRKPIQRLQSIRGVKMEIHKCLQNHASVVDTGENEAPWTLVTYKNRTPALQQKADMML